jgi:hypothetical protein
MSVCVLSGSYYQYFKNQNSFNPANGTYQFRIPDPGRFALHLQENHGTNKIGECQQLN